MKNYLLPIILLLSLCCTMTPFVNCGGDPSTSSGDSGQENPDDDDDTDVNDDADDDLNDDADDDLNDDANDDVDDDLEPRSFAMSAAPFQFDVSVDNISSEFRFHGFDGMVDVLSLHMDNFFGLPWDEFGGDLPLPQVWVDKMTEIKAGADALGVDIYLSLTPISGYRSKLGAKATDVEGELFVDEDWAPGCYNFADGPNHEFIRTAFLHFVRWMVDFFDPAFLTHAIEMNMYDINCPDDYESLIDLLNEAYDQEKAENPDLPIFATFTVSDMWYFPEEGNCWPSDRSCMRGNLAKLENLKTDRFGISSYPIWAFNELGEWPEDFFTAFAEETGMPIAFGETGWGNHSVTVPWPTYEDDCLLATESSDDAQIRYMEYLFEKADEMDADLVVWWSIRDYLIEEVLTSCPCAAPEPWCIINEVMAEADMLAAYLGWGSMGVMDFDLNEKPSAAVWNEWLARPVGAVFNRDM
jgi:hypothetical protein